MTHGHRSDRPACRSARLRQAVAYLNARLADAGPEEFAAVLDRLAHACGGAALADRVALSADLLYGTLSAHGNPHQKTTTALLRAMGLRRVLMPIDTGVVEGR